MSLFLTPIFILFVTNLLLFGKETFFLWKLCPQMWLYTAFYCLLIVHVDGYQYKLHGLQVLWNFSLKIEVSDWTCHIFLNTECVTSIIQNSKGIVKKMTKLKKNFFFFWKQLRAACLFLEAKIWKKYSFFEIVFGYLSYTAGGYLFFHLGLLNKQRRVWWEFWEV